MDKIKKEDDAFLRKKTETKNQNSATIMISLYVKGTASPGKLKLEEESFE